jgi:hypothetical protein
MEQGTPSGCRSEPLTASERRAVWYAVPPLAVLLAANLLFELTGGEYPRLAERVAATAAPAGDVARQSVAAAAALHWAMLALVYLCLIAATAAGSWRALGRSVRGQARRPFLLFAAAVGGLGLVHLAVVDASGAPLRAVFAVTHDALRASPLLRSVDVGIVGGVVAMINVLSPTVTALLFAAGAAAALPPVSGWDEATLAQHAQRVRHVVAMAALFLVAGVLHMAAWTQWAGATLSAAGDAALDEVSVGVTLFWSTTFTLMIAGYYIPVAVRVSAWAETVMDDAGIAAADRRKWLADRGLSFRLHEQLPQIVAMLAPLIAGPLSTTLTAATKALTGS